jgi:hypothetical protein
MYKYKAGVYFDFNSYKIMIILGCHNRTLEKWEQEGTLGFNNNLKEFPKGSDEYLKRLETYNFLKEYGLYHYKEYFTEPGNAYETEAVLESSYGCCDYTNARYDDDYLKKRAKLFRHIVKIAKKIIEILNCEG